MWGRGGAVVAISPEGEELGNNLRCPPAVLTAAECTEPDPHTTVVCDPK